MGRRGRPRKAGKPLVVCVRLRLWPGEDDDLIDLFRRLPHGRRAAAVRMALRGTDLSRLRQMTEAEIPDEEILEGLGRIAWGFAEEKEE